MATTPTQKPIPSEDIRDLKFNAGKIDEFVSSDNDKYVDRLGVDRYTAKGISNSASLLGKPYATLELAQADVDNGTIPNNAIVSVIPADGSKAVILYKNNNGTLTPTGRSIVDASVIERISSMLQTFQTNEYGALLQDSIGNVLFEFLLNGGMGSSAFNISKEGFSCGGYSVMTNTSGNIIVYDGIGNVLIDTAINNNKPDYSLEVLDMQNKLYAQSLRKPISSEISSAIYDYNIVVVNGQSWASGYQAWRHLTRDPIEPGNVLMLGDSVRGNSIEGSFNPLGTAVLKDLVGVTQTTGNPATAMDEAAIDALARGANNQGEELGVPAVNFWRVLQRKYRGVFADPSRKIIVVNVAVPGRTIRQISPGDATGHFENRLIRSLQQIKNALPSGATAAVVAMIHSGHEYDYDATKPEATTDKDEYKGYSLSLYQATEDAGKTVFGHGEKLAVFTEQTGAWWTFDSTNQSIGQAHIELDEENENITLCKPNYFETDKASHRDNNGIRWASMFFGKAMHMVLDRRQSFFTTKIIWAKCYGTTLLFGYRVWEPPLQFKPTYYLTNEATGGVIFANKGFLAKDDAGYLTIYNVKIVADTIISAELNRAPVGQLKITYAPKTTYDGQGNVCDSDESESLYSYKYTESVYPETNIPALVDKPYPQNNFAVAQIIYPEIIS